MSLSIKCYVLQNAKIVFFSLYFLYSLLIQTMTLADTNSLIVTESTMDFVSSVICADISVWSEHGQITPILAHLFPPSSPHTSSLHNSSSLQESSLSLSLSLSPVSNKLRSSASICTCLTWIMTTICQGVTLTPDFELAVLSIIHFSRLNLEVDRHADSPSKNLSVVSIHQPFRTGILEGLGASEAPEIKQPGQIA